MNIIDFHVRVFPDYLSSQEALQKIEPIAREIKRQGKSWFRTFAKSIHQAQTSSRHLPSFLVKPLEKASFWLPYPNLVFESAPEDLLTAMDSYKVIRALVLPTEPYASSEFVQKTAQQHPNRLIAATTVSLSESDPAGTLSKRAEEGARALYLPNAHPGKNEPPAFYSELLEAAADLGLPVILYTGFSPMRPIPLDQFEPWIRTHPDTLFVLAGMNLHFPHEAIDLAEDYSNVFLDTAWQPVETIGESVRRLGAERVLYASDWPLVGNNMELGLGRVEAAKQAGWLTEEQSQNILFKNAQRLLKL